MQKVIIYKKLPDEVKEYLSQYCKVVTFDQITADNYSQFLNELKDADGLLGSGLKIDKELLDHAKQLKVVANTSVGYNNFDLEEMTKRNIFATNTPDVLTDTTADTIFGLLIATARRIPELDTFVKAKQWDKPIGEELYGMDVHHKTLGIIGMGRIGQAIAKRAHRGFDMNILYHNRSRNELAESKYNATYCNLDDLLSQSDYVCLMTPLTSDTKHLIGKREFSLMKNSAIFINGSRGETVVEEELIEALENNEILAAGLDVFTQEPVNKDNKLLMMKNVVTLPHVGSATAETRLNTALFAAENTLKGVRGEIPVAALNLEFIK